MKNIIKQYKNYRIIQKLSSKNCINFDGPVFISASDNPFNSVIFSVQQRKELKIFNLITFNSWKEIWNSGKLYYDITAGSLMNDYLKMAERVVEKYRIDNLRVFL